jgi:UDPglucose--hexose-1-phosphate uridylyltransferase
MGASNPHPHGQLWALDVVPGEPATEDRTQRAHHEATGRTLLGDYAALERGGDRVVVDGDEWLAVVPWWATWPFEVIVLPLRPATRLHDLDDAQRDGLAAVLGEVTVRYDNLFRHPFPYSMGWHQAPGTGEEPHWTVHAHFYPPLLRSATVRKFMVGFEMLAEAQRDLTAEEAAARLRALPVTHYRQEQS